MRPKSRRPHKELGITIRRFREKECQMTLRKFAGDAGVDHTCLLRLENGEDVYLSAFLKLAKTHGFPIP